MKVGISTASLFLKQETEVALQTIKSLGADCAEVFLQTYYEYRPEFSKSLQGKLGGMEINSIHVNTHHIEHSLFSPSRRIRGDALYWLDQVMRSCQLLDCKAYTFHGRYGNGGEDLEGYIARVADFCAGYGVKLCLENVCWSTYHEPLIFSRLKERAPNLYGVLDVKQAVRSGHSYKEYIEDMKGSISHVHLSDIDENGNVCLIGRGGLNFKEILARLKDAGFDGNLIIEVYPESYSDVTELKASLEYLKEIIYKL